LFRTYLWSNCEQADLTSAIGSAALDADSPNVATAQRLPAFVAFTLSLPYLRLVGIALLIVALASIVVLGARRRGELAIELAMTDKMGLPRRTIVAAVAGAAVLLGVLGSLIGIAIARLLVAFMTHRLDPGPAFVPHFSGTVSWSAVIVALGAVVLISLVAAWMEIGGARRARVSEVLRASD
jgi:ABC-type lipoprotein release transport system permease subunit